MNRRIGFMQGRLSPLFEGRIQSFPWSCWQDEFSIAEKIYLHLMEWTLDQENLYKNPLLTDMGQKEIRRLCSTHNITIPSLTGDCFMQAPFWKAQGDERVALERDFRAIAEACATVGIVIIVVPLVDNGRIETRPQEDSLVAYLQSQATFFSEHKLKVVFESDFTPLDLARFISRLDPALFGINYDVGNSAAMAFNPSEELDAYGSRIVNVHIKDRKLGGTTVPLGTGSVDFDDVFGALAKNGYNGNYILQTARANDGNHSRVLSRYRDMALDWIKKYGT